MPRSAAEALARALATAEGKVRDGTEKILQLTARPLSYATVIFVHPAQPVPDGGSYAKGTPVRVTRGEQVGKYGSVIGEVDAEGTVAVQLDGGSEARFRVADQRPPEAILEGSPSRDPLAYTLGLRVVEAAHRFGGWRGTVTRTVDPAGRIEVACDDGEVRTPFVGEPPEVEPYLMAGGSATVVADAKLLEVALPAHLNLQPGTVVTLTTDGKQAVSVADIVPTGELASFVRRVDDRTVEVQYRDGKRIVYSTVPFEQLHPGDRVVVDGSVTVILRNLGEPEGQFKIWGDQGVEWSDVVGQDAVVATLQEVVETIYELSADSNVYGIEVPAGLLESGPPGCGKTLSARALATAVARRNAALGIPPSVMYVEGPEPLSEFVGVGERMIRSMAAWAETFFKRYGVRPFIIIDEVDALAKKRGKGVSSDVNDTFVPQLLAKMNEGFAVWVLLTNRPDVLDPALVRDKRVDIKLYVGRPSEAATQKTFERYLRGVKLADGLTVEALVQRATAELMSPSRVLYQCPMKTSGDMPFTLAELRSGAMVDNIVNLAKLAARRRDKAKGGQPSGLGQQDLVDAVAQVFAQQRGMNHEDDLADFYEQHREELTGRYTAQRQVRS